MAIKSAVQPRVQGWFKCSCCEISRPAHGIPNRGLLREIQQIELAIRQGLQIDEGGVVTREGPPSGGPCERNP